MTAPTAEDTAFDVLSAIRGFHSKQDTSDTVVDLWAAALTFGEVTSAADAVRAVVRHYATPGCNPWITPGDVIAGYKAVRAERTENVDIADLTEDVDPRDAAAYLATYRCRLKAVADGATVQQANRIPLPPEAAHAAIDRTARPVLTAGDQ